MRGGSGGLVSCRIEYCVAFLFSFLCLRIVPSRIDSCFGGGGGGVNWWGKGKLG